jgi:hypothetical protein
MEISDDLVKLLIIAGLLVAGISAPQIGAILL